MHFLEDVDLFYRKSSNLDAGVEGTVLLNNGFYYSVTIYDTFTDWKDIAVLEDQYTNDQLEAIEKELISLYTNNCILQ